MRIAQNNIPSGLKEIVQLKGINSFAIAQANRWEESLSRSDDATWSWSKGFRSYSTLNALIWQFGSQNQSYVV